jgi:hypothetical protein
MPLGSTLTGLGTLVKGTAEKGVWRVLEQVSRMRVTARERQ